MEKISGKYTIKQIFQDHWGDYLVKHPDVSLDTREVVKKMLECRNPDKLGYSKMACPDHPEAYTVIPHSCKSRFCNSCGKVAVDNWLSRACDNFPNVSYSHITFTIPCELRELFLKRPKLRKILFDVSSDIILDWCKGRGWIPAITSVLHTFGKDLKFHPHIHMLVSAGGLDVLTKTKWTDCPYLPEGMLKKRWQALLLYRLYGERLITHNLKRKLFEMTWYIFIERQLLLAVVTTNYIGRYTKRPPLAQARIANYNGNSVSFNYEDYYQGKLISSRTVNTEEFIGLLIQHIPPKHFRLIRHYGLLNNRARKKHLPLLRKLFGKIKSFVEKTTWRIRQKLHQKRDPLSCPKCGKEMELVEIAFWSKSRDALYVKAIE